MTAIDTTAPVAAPAGEAPALARTAGPLEVFAQSLAAAAPSVAIAGVPGGIFLVSGQGTLYSIVLGTIVVALVAYTISLQARRTVSSGSLATYTGNGLGPGAAFAAGWGLIIGYAGFGIGALLGALVYSSAFLDKLGIDSQSTAVGVVLVLAAFTPAVYSAYRGLKLSARLAIVLEVVSLLLIGVIFVAAWITHGLHIDTDQLTAKGASSTGIILGAVLAVGAYAGFESAASLGRETHDAHRTISRVLLRIVGGLALLYLVASYTEILGFGGLTGDSAPLHAVGEWAGVSWTSYPVDIGISISMVAFGAAVLNAGARSLFTFADEGALPKRLASVHPRHGSPYVGIVVLGAVALAGALAFVIAGTGALRASTYVGTVSTYGYFTAYVLISIATPLWLRRIDALTPAAVVTGALAAGAMLYVVYKNLVPAPPSPYNLLPYIYLGLLAIGLVYYAVLRVREPERARAVGTSQERAV
jgi:amino acid transporter